MKQDKQAATIKPTVTVEGPYHPQAPKPTVQPYRIEVPPSTEQRQPRPGTKRAAVLALLLDKGATVEEVMTRTAQDDLKGINAGPWDRRTAAEGVRLIARQCGYGLTTDANGVIRAYRGEKPVSAKVA